MNFGLMTLGTEGGLEGCMNGHALAPILMNGFRALVILMALNMLIAQMSTTYERIRERLATNFMFLTALVIVSTINEPDVKFAPLNLLGVPYHVSVYVYYKAIKPTIALVKGA